MINFKKYLTPKLFTGLAIVGVGATVYFAVKESKDAVRKEERVEQEETKPEDGSGSQTEVEAADNKKGAKEFINAAVDTFWAYKFTGTSALITILFPGGEEALKAVKKEVVATRTKDILDEENGHKKGDFWRHQSVEWTGNGDLLCYDHFTGRYFRSNEDAVREGISMWNDDREYEFNDRTGDIRYEYDDESDINDLYSYLNLERSQLNSMYHFPQQRRIKINLTRIPVERLDPVTMARYNEDLLIMEYDDKSMPIDKARKLTASDIYSL